MQKIEYNLRMRAILSRAFCVLAASLVAFSAATFEAARAAELVMFERAGCPWCQRWEREVAPIYPNTPEGRQAPLRKVDLDRGVPTDLTLDAPVRFTPTFVLVENGREIGRVTGYINDATFWGLLEKLLLKTDPKKS